jgi:hypothetical protein
MHATRWAVTEAGAAVPSIVIVILIRCDGIHGPLLLLLMMMIKLEELGRHLEGGGRSLLEFF